MTMATAVVDNVGTTIQNHFITIVDRDTTRNMGGVYSEFPMRNVGRECRFGLCNVVSIGRFFDVLVEMEWFVEILTG